MCGIPGALQSADIIPIDFNEGLADGEPIDGDAVTAVAATYQNSIGIVFNQNVENRNDRVRLANQEVSPEIAARFEGKSGDELAAIAEQLAKKSPDRASEIAAAAILQNMRNNGPATLDTLIASRVLTALNGSLPADAVARIMAYGTERLPGENIDGALRTLRGDYLANINPDTMPETAKVVDTALVTNRIAIANKLTPQAMQAYAGLAVPQQGESTPDTNPFFSGVTGPTNLGGFGGAGGGSSGGSGSSPTPTPSPSPTPTPAPPPS